jgi:phosphate transport system substrate-binding protein
LHAQKRHWLIGFLAVTILTAACGGGDGTSKQAGSEAPGGGGKLTGTINISGSSTVAPITTRVADKWVDEEPGVKVNVDGPGTGDGFVLFCNGETDISDASRPIKKAEADACAAKGIQFIELKVGIDGLTVMTNPANTSVACLSTADLYALAGPDSQGFKKWSDGQALAKELGSKTVFPNANLDMYAPGEESGTYDSFVELAIEPIAKKRAEARKIKSDQVKTTRPDYSSSGDDNIILQGIEGSKSSFGWVGFAYAEGQAGKVKEIKISKDPGGECVEPTAETISSAKYPLSRYLYIYVNAAKEKQNPAIGRFVDFYLDEGISSVPEVKYVALAPTDLTATRGVWTARTVGTRDGGK